jgi:hypothetical protein
VTVAAVSDARRGHILHELGFAVARSGEHELSGTAAIVPALCVPDTSVLRHRCWRCGRTRLPAFSPSMPFDREFR